MSMYIIDDHPLVRQAIAMLLRRMRPASKVIELEKFSELQAAIIKNGEPELFVLDLLLPGVKRTSAVKEIKGMYATVPLAVISSMPAGEAEETCIEAGADMLFPEAITELDMYKQFAQKTGAPILANITEFGSTPLFTTEELASADVSLALYPLSAFRAMNKAAETVYETLRKEGTQKNVIDIMQTRKELYERINYYAFEDYLDNAFAKKK